MTESDRDIYQAWHQTVGTLPILLKGASWPGEGYPAVLAAGAVS